MNDVQLSLTLPEPEIPAPENGTGQTLWFDLAAQKWTPDPFAAWLEPESAP